MKRKYAALGITALFVFVTLGSALAQSDEAQLKKLETDRAAAAVKGDVATLEKQTADDYTYAIGPPAVRGRDSACPQLSAPLGRAVALFALNRPGGLKSN